MKKNRLDKIIEIITQNATKARLLDRAEIRRADALSYLSGYQGDPFHLVFLDPPYADGFLDEALHQIAALSLLAPHGVVVAEFDFGTMIDIQNYNLLKDKRYGRVCINILEAQ